MEPQIDRHGIKNIDSANKKRVKLLKPISECEEFNSKLEKDEIKSICKKIHKSLKKVTIDQE